MFSSFFFWQTKFWTGVLTSSELRFKTPCVGGLLEARCGRSVVHSAATTAATADSGPLTPVLVRHVIQHHQPGLQDSDVLPQQVLEHQAASGHGRPRPLAAQRQLTGRLARTANTVAERAVRDAGELKPRGGLIIWRKVSSTK